MYTMYTPFHCCAHTYTGRQLYGITLLTPPLCFTAGGNLCQCQFKSPGNILKLSLGSLITVYGRPSLYACSGQSFFLKSADFPNCPKISMAHFCWLHSFLSRRCMTITISNQSRNHANHYPDDNHWKYCSFLSSLPFAERDPSPASTTIMGMTEFSSCCWKAIGKLQPRNRWNSWTRRPEW